MNAERLLALYEQVSEAPDAVPRLRRFVLDLAVRGKLVEQEAGDEPASELLKRIAIEKARREKAGEIRRTRNYAELSADDPCELPGTWLWVPFGELHHLVRGVTYSKGDVSEVPTEGYAPILRANNIGPKLTQDDPVYVKAERVSPDQYLRRGDYMVALSSGSRSLVGKAALVTDNLDFAFGGFCGALRPFDPVLVGFFGVFLSSDLYRENISAGSRGIGINNLKKEVLANLHFPLPPLAEQRRIVAKVEELMALLDRLEAARTVREATRDRLTAASLARLTAPDADPAEFPANARFALTTLPALTTRPDQIKPLRQTILNLAVRGKLVDGSSCESATVGEYRKLQNGYAFKSDWFVTSGIRLLRNANIGHGEIRWDETVHLPEDRFEEFERFRLRKGDIVLTLDRPFIVTGTKVARVTEADLPSLLLQRVGRFVETADGLVDDYLFLWINSPHFNDQIDPGRSNGVPHISSKQVEAAEIYVPPIAEQHRIVAKVDALMALCDRLEAALTAADTARARLLEALLHEALGGTLSDHPEVAT